MYKVFFNDLIILFSTKRENSFKNNTYQVVEFESVDCLVEQMFICEHQKQPNLFVFYHPDFLEAWDQFRRRFVGIDAAGGIVKNSHGQVLFIRRFGKWDLPKGKVEKRESIEQAAVREVEEECNISGLLIGRKLPSTFHIYRSPFLQAPENLVLKETHWFEMFYPGNDIPKPQEEEQIEEVRWFNAGKIDEVLANTYPSLKDLFHSESLKQYI